MDHQINAHAPHNRADAENLLDIHNAHAAQLHEVAHHLRRFAEQRAPHAGDIHHVVGDELMAVLDELQRAFALAHAAFAGNHQPHAEHIQQHAVAGLPRGERLAQIGDGLRRKEARLLVRSVHGHAVFARLPEQLRRALHPSGDDDAGDVIRKIALEPFAAHVLRQVIQIGHLGFADDLRPFERKDVEIPRELQAGSAKVGHLDAGLLFLSRVADGSQRHGAGELFGRYAHHPFPPVRLTFIIPHRARKDQLIFGAVGCSSCPCRWRPAAP